MKKTTAIVSGIALVPLVALPAAAFLLRWGAPGPVHAARIEAANPDREGHLAWQMVTAVEDRNVREAVALEGLTVVLHGAFGDKVWQGETDRDGVAEIAWEGVKVAPGDALTLAAHASSHKFGDENLGFGPVTWPSADSSRPTTTSTTATTAVPQHSFATPTHREGALVIDVAIPGQHVVAGFEVPIWIRVQDATTGEAVAGASLAFTPEPGIELARTQAVTCRAGWAQVGTTAIMHVGEMGIEAHAGDRAGAWYGGVPVAPGASVVELPRIVPADKAVNVDVQLVGARELEYLEVDDDHGRVFGASLPLALGAEGRRHAHAALPPLSAGDYWLVTSGAPRGATTLDGATVARPMHVADPNVPSLDPCAESGELASRMASPFPRFVALDGFAQRDRSPELRRMRTAKWVATAILASGGFIESILLSLVSRDSRRRIAAIEGATATSAARTYVLIAIAWLGFAFFVALIWVKA